MNTNSPLLLKRVSLSALTNPALHGINKYSEGVAASIDFPFLTFVKMRFLDKFIIEAPFFLSNHRSCGRNIVKSPDEVIVNFSQDNASNMFTRRGGSRNLAEHFLVIFCGPLDRQRTQIFTQLERVSRT